MRTVTGDQLVDLLGTPGALAGSGALGGPDRIIVVDHTPTSAVPDIPLTRLATTPVIVVGGPAWASAPAPHRDLVDVIAADDDEMGAITATVTAAPIAATALVMHLRTVSARTVTSGLVNESSLYSALQAGPEFAAWRGANPVRSRPPSAEPAVVVTRAGNELRIELNRPDVRNAFNTAMRDGLCDALAIADADPDVRVTITGRGPAFCAGGDLDEFGTAPDPATAHLVRLERSVGAVLARIADRVTVRIHGPCYGSGIELPAFAGHVVADRRTTVALPELGLGLIPGAGGTVSLPARIGRHATAWLALTRRAIDAPAALRLGLVDEVGDAR